MGTGAKVTSIVVLREFRPALIKFVEEGRAAVIAAESECNRTLEWLRRDRLVYWKKEIRRRQDEINQAKTDLLNKQRSATGDPRSAVEERKALEKAKRRLEEAVQKQANTKHWLRQLEKEHMQYKGMAQALTGQLTRLEDKALYDLDRMAEALEDYVAMAVPTMEQVEQSGVAGSSGGQAGAGMGRGENAVEAKPSPFAGYRRATPSAGRRRRAVLSEPDEGAIAISLDRVESLRQRDELAALMMNDDPDVEKTISVSRGALCDGRVYVERSEPVDDQDSGWYLASAPESGPVADRRELNRVPLSAVLSLRPDLEPVFRLCEGCLVVIDGAKVESVTAPNDTLAYEAGAEEAG